MAGSSLPDGTCRTPRSPQLGCGLLWLSLLSTDAQVMALAPVPTGSGPDRQDAAEAHRPTSAGSRSSSVGTAPDRISPWIDRDVAVSRRPTFAGTAPAWSAPMPTGVDSAGPDDPVASSSAICVTRCRAPDWPPPPPTGSDPDRTRCSRSYAVRTFAVYPLQLVRRCRRPPSPGAGHPRMSIPISAVVGTSPDYGAHSDDDGNRHPHHRPADPSRAPACCLLLNGFGPCCNGHFEPPRLGAVVTVANLPEPALLGLWPAFSVP